MSLIVVTGAAGFIGSQIALRLLTDGVPAKDILAVDTSKIFFETRRCSVDFAAKGIQFLEHHDFVSRLEKGELSPEVIYHMGACSSTDETREDYLNAVNLNYSKTLWNLSVKKQIKFVYASSAATYGGGEKGFSDDPSVMSKLKPLNLYGWSKQNFDLFVTSELTSGRAPKTWSGLKFFNVYGPGEWHKGTQASVMFHARNQIAATGILKLFQSHKAGIQDGEQKRDFVFVDDCVDVALACARGTVKPGIYNVGSGEARSFLDLGRAVFSALSSPEKIEFIPTPERLREHYQYYTCATLARLRAAGFTKPMTRLEDGVKKYMSRWGAGF